MKWMTAIMIGAILAVVLPMSLGGRDGVWMTGWTETWTIHPIASSPGLLFSIPVFLISAIGLRLFFNWHGG
ncbi:hypothetical protein H9L12_08625 [Sphingomonas rhizophila]|uniref:Uncharacterized protein n=1 Tax=Sphingomonas rhizophila TaxID=2071607 RepID=A0A7G9S967_9SPHN|nr:hypothetical protein [Sphingomonas rhizophila]QNN64392.1 hypothetical protein H9L12_08625 [Sphingomonas rhizophila]